MSVDLMPRCRDCRWWDRTYGSMGPDGRCMAVKTNQQTVPDGLAFIAVWNSPIADGWLCTAPDFGCVQFERKD